MIAVFLAIDIQWVICHTDQRSRGLRLCPDREFGPTGRPPVPAPEDHRDASDWLRRVPVTVLAVL